MDGDRYTPHGVAEGTLVALHLETPDDTEDEEVASGPMFRDENGKYWISDTSGYIKVPDDPRYHLHPMH